MLDVRPAAVEAEDDPPNWELVSPTGIALQFGPGLRWQIGGATCPSPRVAEATTRSLARLCCGWTPDAHETAHAYRILHNHALQPLSPRW